MIKSNRKYSNKNKRREEKRREKNMKEIYNFRERYSAVIGARSIPAELTKRDQPFTMRDFLFFLSHYDCW